MENRVIKMQECTNLAISMMNDELSFEKMKVYLEQAFSLCSPTEDLAYYQIMATVFCNLSFRTRTAIGMSKVKKQYLLLFEYMDEKFSSIVNFNVDANNVEEANVVNSICCDIYNGTNRYYLAFYNSHVNAGAIWGLAGIGIAHASLKNFRKHINSIGKNAALVLKKYNTLDEQILKNIKEFSGEK